ncbi:unnamed protein product, partial [Prorocentrum cordatum]
TVPPARRLQRGGGGDADQASPGGPPPQPEDEAWRREKRGSGEPAGSAEVRRQRVKAWQRDPEAWPSQRTEWYRQKS